MMLKVQDQKNNLFTAVARDLQEYRINDLAHMVRAAATDAANAGMTIFPVASKPNTDVVIGDMQSGAASQELAEVISSSAAVCRIHSEVRSDGKVTSNSYTIYLLLNTVGKLGSWGFPNPIIRNLMGHEVGHTFFSETIASSPLTRQDEWISRMRFLDLASLRPTKLNGVVARFLVCDKTMSEAFAEINAANLFLRDREREVTPRSLAFRALSYSLDYGSTDWQHSVPIIPIASELSKAKSVAEFFEYVTTNPIGLLRKVEAFGFGKGVGEIITAKASLMAKLLTEEHKKDGGILI